MEVFTIIFFVIFGLAFFLIFTTAITTIYRNHKMISKHIDNASKGNNIDISDRTTDQMEKMAAMMGKVAAEMAEEMNPE